MGARIEGLDELIHDLETFQERGRPKWRGVLSRGGVQIKKAWRARWSPEIGNPPQHLPHVVRGIGYDTSETADTFSAVIGVNDANPQAPLAHFAEFGSPTGEPHPGGQPSLDEEDPRFVQAVADVAVELLEGR